MIEYIENGVTKTKLFKSVHPENPLKQMHSEVVALKWLDKQGIDRASVTRLYSEFHPCQDLCDGLVRASFPNARIEYSWPYWSSSFTDEITNMGRAMRREALRGLR